MSADKDTASRMTEAELISEVYPRYARKELARLLAVPVKTVCAWFDRGIAARRRAEIFQRLLEIYDQETCRRVEIRRQLEILANARRFQSNTKDHLGTGSADGTARQLAKDITPKG